MITSQQITDLVSLARHRQLEAEDFDDTVHDLKSGEAADINNGGLEEQIKYIACSLGYKEAERTIKETAHEEVVEADTDEA